MTIGVDVFSAEKPLHVSAEWAEYTEGAGSYPVLKMGSVTLFPDLDQVRKIHEVLTEFLTAPLPAKLHRMVPEFFGLGRSRDVLLKVSPQAN